MVLEVLRMDSTPPTVCTIASRTEDTKRKLSKLGMTTGQLLTPSSDRLTSAPTLPFDRLTMVRTASATLRRIGDARMDVADLCTSIPTDTYCLTTTTKTTRMRMMDTGNSEMIRKFSEECLRLTVPRCKPTRSHTRTGRT